MVSEIRHSNPPYNEQRYLHPAGQSNLLVLDITAALAALDRLTPTEQADLLWPALEPVPT